MKKLNIINFYILGTFKFIITLIFLDLMLVVRVFFLLENVFEDILAANYYSIDLSKLFKFMVRFQVFMTFEGSSNLFYLRLAFAKGACFLVSLALKNILLAGHFCIIVHSST